MNHRRKQKTEDAFWVPRPVWTGLIYCVKEEKGKHSSPLPLMLLLFWTASQEHLFPPSLSFFFSFPSSLSSLTPFSLALQKLMQYWGLQLFIPVALLLVLVVTWRADFTNSLRTPAVPRKFVPSLASGLFWVGGPMMPSRFCSFQLSGLHFRC